jgi:hypothetical protein
MINLAGFVEELIEVGKGEGVCWDGRFYLFAAVEGQAASVVCVRQRLIVLCINQPPLTIRRQFYHITCTHLFGKLILFKIYISLLCVQMVLEVFYTFYRWWLIS